MTINEAIDLLKAYNGPLGLTLHSGASEKLISEVEKAYGITLPDDFKALYRFTDGFETLEDIFNMIPLSEIIDNSKKEHELWIAEYMIYSDMWELEIDVEDPNDYVILSGDSEGERNVILTKSLAEFIARFLKGGVFEIGGLYAWRAEIKAKLHGNTTPGQIKQLLGVYREGLKVGLITRKEVIVRADWIIATEDEPDYFFIELSLSHDVNELFTVLNSMDIPEDVLYLRVLLGVMQTQFSVELITADKARAVLNKFIYHPGLTRYERRHIYSITDDDNYPNEKPDEQTRREFNEHVKDFLDNYSQFNLYNYKNWNDINTELLKRFKVKQKEDTATYHVHRKKIKVKYLPARRTLALMIGILATIGILAGTYYYDPGMLPICAVIMGITFARNFKLFRRR